MRRLLTEGAPLVAEHGLQGAWASVTVVRKLRSFGSWALENRLNYCGTWAQLLLGMYDLPGTGIEPSSLALLGTFFTGEPRGKPSIGVLAKGAASWSTKLQLNGSAALSQVLRVVKAHGAYA